MEQRKIDRINELAKKAKSGVELTDEEIKERALLRKEYIESIRANFKSVLDNIEFKDEEEKKQ